VERTQGVRRWRGLFWSMLVIAGPPLLFLLGVVIFSATTYNGICPGLMDVSPYPCSVWEYIGRNTVSPFALVVNLTICGGWVILSTILVTLFLGMRYVVQRGKEDTEGEGGL
jgi:hypothetical protein